MTDVDSLPVRWRQYFTMCTRRQFFRKTLPLLTLAFSGCGVEAYQERMVQNTVPLFDYKLELDSNLGSEWRKGEVRLRLPSWYSEVPAPKKDQADRRVPPGLDGEFVGLLGGFQGKIESTTSEGKTKEIATYAMVLSNRVLLASRDPKVKPSKFAQMFLAELSRSVGGDNFLSDSSLNRITIGQSIPPKPSDAWAPTLRYDWGSLAVPGGAVPMEYRVYVHDAPPLQVVIAFLVPKEAARSERLSERIELSLQTLRLDSASSASSGPAPPTSGGSPTF